MRLYIIKLGGSIITAKKTGTAVVNTEVIRDLCAEIATAHQTQPDLRIIVLHGAGSFGHPLVRKFDLKDKPLTHNRLLGVGRALINARYLTTTIAEQLRKHDTPALPLQTSSLVFQAKSDFHLFGENVIEQLLRAQAVPVFGGDLVVTSRGTTTVMSADTLAVLLAERFTGTSVLFATDVAGVYKQWPSLTTQQPIARLSRPAIQEIVAEQAVTADWADVTGGMRGKLQALLRLSQGNVRIFNGLVPMNLQKALAGQDVGTTISLTPKSHNKLFLP